MFANGHVEQLGQERAPRVVLEDSVARDFVLEAQKKLCAAAIENKCSTLILSIVSTVLGGMLRVHK